MVLIFLSLLYIPYIYRHLSVAGLHIIGNNVMWLLLHVMLSHGVVVGVGCSDFRSARLHRAAFSLSGSPNGTGVHAIGRVPCVMSCVCDMCALLFVACVGVVLFVWSSCLFMIYTSIFNNDSVAVVGCLVGYIMTHA